jgi:3-methyladenine DNA glycosylase AlkD
MKAAEARALGQRIRRMLLSTGAEAGAIRLLGPTLASRISFPILEIVGEAICAETPPLRPVLKLLDLIAATDAEGGWVIIGSVLRQLLPSNVAESLRRCRRYVVKADVWYAADILGERVVGAMLLIDFDQAIERLAPWREDPNRWVRRALGAGIHNYAKRSSASAKKAEARAALRFLEPLLAEREVDAIKGLGWGLKTLGKHHPDIVADWLAENAARSDLKIHRVMLRKAVTYLGAAQRCRVLGSAG